MRAVLLLLVLGCSLSPASTPAPEPTPTPKAAPAEPNWSPIDTAGLRTLLASPGDKVRVVNFWASWCGPCLRELPHLVEFARRRPNAEVILVNVDAKAVQPKTVVPMLRRHQHERLTHLLLDADNPLGALREAVDDWPDRIPVTTILDRNGTRTKTWIEELPMSELDREVAAAAEVATKPAAE
jgi:thiol-disulfide isomerase/thioredoxin